VVPDHIAPRFEIKVDNLPRKEFSVEKPAQKSSPDTSKTLTAQKAYPCTEGRFCSMFYL